VHSLLQLVTVNGDRIVVPPSTRSFLKPCLQLVGVGLILKNHLSPSATATAVGVGQRTVTNAG